MPVLHPVPVAVSLAFDTQPNAANIFIPILSPIHSQYLSPILNHIRSQSLIPILSHTQPSLTYRYSALYSATPSQVPVPLPHPRDWTMKTSPDFAALKARLMGEIREEVRKAAMA